MMSSREKLGLGILIGLFVLFAVLLVFLLKGKSRGASRDLSESAIIQQRMINLKKK
ncbi:MAG: hypothetical protein GWP08_02735 [Nitrospiraceae bacterium]|nr:hypothetical protein [Nitrospiraceae bacterium]